MANQNMNLPKEEITAFCLRWKISELALFGSLLRDDFGPHSNIDVLASFQPDADWGLLDHAQMEQELATILGRQVDLVTRRSIEQSSNSIRRQAILNTARTVHVSR